MVFPTPQAEEAVWAGDRSAQGVLKSLITEPEMLVERKGVDPVKMRNLMRVMFTSNEDWVVPAALDDRRFACFDVGVGWQLSSSLSRASSGTERGGSACAGSKAKSPPPVRKSGHEPAPFGTTRHYVAQDQPLHVVVGGCALSSEGVCILGFRPDLHRVQGAVATWVKTGENPAAARRAGGKRGGMQGPCGCARGTPF